MKDKILCHMYIFPHLSFAFYNITNFDRDHNTKANILLNVFSS